VPRPALALAALILGCGPAATAMPVVVVELPPPPPPSAADEPDVNEVPFAGVYQRYAMVAYRNGRAVTLSNATGRSSLQVGPGRVVYDQTYSKEGKERHVIQTYSFDPAVVQRSSDTYEIPLRHRSMRGDVVGYSADNGRPRLAVRKRPWGWSLVLMTVDASQVIAGVAYGAAPPGEPGPDLSEYRAHVEKSPE
jgi:hypothetical protein